jgi:hypothetical protein
MVQFKDLQKGMILRKHLRKGIVPLSIRSWMRIYIVMAAGLKKVKFLIFEQPLPPYKEWIEEHIFSSSDQTWKLASEEDLKKLIQNIFH